MKVERAGRSCFPPVSRAASNGTSGRVGSYSYFKSAGAWLFCARLPVEIFDKLQTRFSRVFVDFSSVRIQGEGQWTILEPENSGSTTVQGVCLLRSQVDAPGALAAFAFEIEKQEFQLVVDGSSDLIAEEVLATSLASFLDQCGSSRDCIGLINLLSPPSFAGIATLHELNERVFLAVDEAIRCGPRGVILIGWLLARPGALREIRFRSGRSAIRLSIEESVRVERPDVIEKVAVKFGFGDRAPGFVCFLPTAVAPHQSAYLEIETKEGEIGFAALPEFLLEGIPSIKRILEAFEVEFAGLSASFDRIVGPSVAQLNAQRFTVMPSVSEAEFGKVNHTPAYSLIIPLHGRLDYLEYQFALMSIHEPIKAQEVILVLDDPQKKKQLLLMAEGLYQRFKIPFRVLALDRNMGFGPASNIGLDHAHGRYACFLNSDVFPGTPDWMERLIDRLVSDPAIGVIGPMLLYETGAVQHEGMEFVRRPEFADWYFPDHTRKGMKPSGEPGVKCCAAITGAAMVFETAFMRSLGGFDNAYIIGDFEDSDLCLRVQQKSRICAVDRDVWLYHLERKSQAGSHALWRRNLTLYNAWVHQNRWPEIPQVNHSGAMVKLASQPIHKDSNSVAREVRSAGAEPALVRPKVLVICHAHPEISHGGAENAAFQLFHELQTSSVAEAWFLGCQRDEEARRLVLPISQPFGEREFLYAGGEFEWFNFANRDPKFADKFSELLQALNPDVVHFHHYAVLGVEALLIARRALPNANLVLTLHEYLAICHNQGQMIIREDKSLCHRSGPVRCSRCFPHYPPADFFLRKLYLQRFLGLVDHFIAPSHFLAERYAAWGIPAEKVTVIENVVRKGSQGPAEKTTSASVPLRAGFFGQISELKGMDIFLGAAEILEQGGTVNVIFEIFGDYRNQGAEYKDRFLKSMAESRVNVRYHGAYENERVDHLMRSVDVVVIPSIWWENSPVVIQEAFRNRCPVVCSDIGGMREKVRDGVDGFHFPAGSAAHLAELLNQLALDRQRLEAVRETMAEPGESRSVIDQHLQIYSALRYRAKERNA